MTHLPGGAGRRRPNSGVWRFRVGVAVTAALGAAAACARQGAPPGGPPDRIPPFVVSTRPDTFEVVGSYDGSVRVEFNERISERTAGGRMDAAVEVSPRTGDVRVGHGRRSIDVSISGGFVDGLVYRITVLPVIQDMFGNSLREPFEFFFSTGPAFTDNALAGVLEDRVTGQPVPAARVDAWQAGQDSVVHTTVSDDQGIFALRRIPGGVYDLRAYVDVNRTYGPDFIELQGRAAAQAVGAADTVLVFLDLLQPDTTPARLVRVAALDSVTLELSFDDFLDPDSSLEAVSVILEPDSTAEGAVGAPVVERLLHAHQLQHYADSLRAVADSLAALASDTAGAAAVPRLPPPAAGVAPGAGEGRILPAQRLIGVLDGPLVPSLLYRVVAADVTNLAQIEGGGGEARVAGPEPPPPDTTPADTAVGAAPVDSLAADTVPPAGPGPPAPDTLATDTLPGAEPLPPARDTLTGGMAFRSRLPFGTRRLRD